MIGNDQVRFCSHCNLSVHNLSEMTRAEAMKLVLDSKGRLCARFNRRPDGAIQTAPLPETLHRIKRRASRVATGAFSAALSLSAGMVAHAQSPMSQSLPGVVELRTQNDGAQQESSSPLSAQIVGTILDSQGAVIPSAAVTLINEKTQIEKTAVSNDNGEYGFQVSEAGTYTVKVDAMGFSTGERKNLTVQASVEERVDMTLEAADTVTTMGIVAFSPEPTEPLVVAAAKNDLVAVRQLLATGADVNVLDKETDMTALAEAVSNGNREIVQALLWVGAEANARNRIGQTALMNLSDHTSAQIVWDLVAADAKVNLKDEMGNSALMVAAALDNGDVVQALLDAGAKINTRNNEGQTALMMAVSQGRSNSVKMLLTAGADLNKRDKEGRTALNYAEEYEHAEIAEFLELHGAVKY
jgi:ankyrin repeat protein